MTQSQIRSETGPPPIITSAFRAPAWLLVATLPAYVAFLVLSVSTLAPKVEFSSAELSPAEIGAMGLGWMALAITWMMPVVLAAAALVLLSRRLPSGGPLRIVPVLGGFAALLAMVHVMVNLLAPAAESPTWGDSPLFTASMLSSLLAGWIGVHPATLIVLWALVQAGIAKRTAIVVGVIYALYWAFELLVYLPVLLSPEGLSAETVGLPPFLLGILWAAVGGALLRARVASDP